MEAFSDGVIAIIITIMVLELKAPKGVEWSALSELIPVFLSYVLSFVFVGIYWSNHHHLLMAVQKVSGPVLWANLHLLFWLSLTPFVTAWMGENNFQPIPVALYGVVLLFSAVAYFILVKALLGLKGENALLAQALGSDLKGRISIVFYAVGIPLAFMHVGLALACYISVSAMWLIPDRRIEKRLKH
jgi:uncharacterized membrane protein